MRCGCGRRTPAFACSCSRSRRRGRRGGGRLSRDPARSRRATCQGRIDQPARAEVMPAKYGTQRDNCRGDAGQNSRRWSAAVTIGSLEARTLSDAERATQRTGDGGGCRGHTGVPRPIRGLGVYDTPGSRSQVFRQRRPSGRGSPIQARLAARRAGPNYEDRRSRIWRLDHGVYSAESQRRGVMLPGCTGSARP